MPGGQGKNPPRTFRPPPGLWAEVKEIAERRGETVTDVITAALERYVRRNRT